MNKKYFNGLLSFLSLEKETVKEEPKPSIYQNVNDLSDSFASLRETVHSAGESLKMMYAARLNLLAIINARLKEINAFALTPEFTELMKTNPAAIQKLRDEVDSLVKQANNI